MHDGSTDKNIHHATSAESRPQSSSQLECLLRWTEGHLDLALRICYFTAFIVFAIILAWLWPSMQLGAVVLGGVLVRVILFGAQRLAEHAYANNVIEGRFAEAARGLGVTKQQQTNLLLRMVVSNGELADHVALYIVYALNLGITELSPVIREFENIYGKEPSPGEDDNIFRRLLQKGVRFHIPSNPPPEQVQNLGPLIPWSELWLKWSWRRLLEDYPGESLQRLVLRLYATEWQSLFAPIWVFAFIGAGIILSEDSLSVENQGRFFYAILPVLVGSAIWLAFILRPAAFNASLMAGDFDRCAYWVLESAEGKAFLVSALGSHKPALRHQAIMLLLWNDALIMANVTLPEGMRAFMKRES